MEEEMGKIEKLIDSEIVKETVDLSFNIYSKNLRIGDNGVKYLCEKDTSKVKYGFR